MPETSTFRKLLWFVALWMGGVLTVTGLGLVLKLVIGAGRSTVQPCSAQDRSDSLSALAADNLANDALGIRPGAHNKGGGSVCLPRATDKVEAGNS